MYDTAVVPINNNGRVCADPIQRKLLFTTFATTILGHWLTHHRLELPSLLYQSLHNAPRELRVPLRGSQYFHLSFSKEPPYLYQPMHPIAAPIECVPATEFLSMEDLMNLSCKKKYRMQATI